MLKCWRERQKHVRRVRPCQKHGTCQRGMPRVKQNTDAYKTSDGKHTQYAVNPQIQMLKCYSYCVPRVDCVTQYFCFRVQLFRKLFLMIEVLQGCQFIFSDDVLAILRITTSCQRFLATCQRRLANVQRRGITFQRRGLCLPHVFSDACFCLMILAFGVRVTTIVAKKGC